MTNLDPLTPTLKVCSYNIHKGFSVGNRQFLLKNIRDSIRRLNIDILFLQEVVGDNRKHRSKQRNWVCEPQFEYLADTVWPHHAYGRNAVYDHGHHGNAILSKYSLRAENNINMSVIPFSDRGVLHCQTCQDLHLLCAHLGLFYRERKRQVDKIIHYIHDNIPASQPLIMAGDFNDWHKKIGPRFSNELQLQEVSTAAHNKQQATFPAIYPLLPMDRIYYRGLTLSNAKTLKGPPWNQLSDHCAVYAEFSL